MKISPRSISDDAEIERSLAAAGRALRAGVVALAVVNGLAACAEVALGASADVWSDREGDRGVQVLARDYAQCAALVETRRSLMTGCMAVRGWASPATGQSQ